jgi:hypothetical protein
VTNPDGGTASGGTVKLTAGEWEKRAQVAADGAARLAAAAHTLAQIGTKNYFGDCIEGASMHGALTPVLQRWATDLARQADALSETAKACTAAAPVLAAADAQSSQDLQA